MPKPTHKKNKTAAAFILFKSEQNFFCFISLFNFIVHHVCKIYKDFFEIIKKTGIAISLYFVERNTFMYVHE